MHEGDFKTGLEIFDRQGAIQWAKGQEESRAALVRQWAEDSAAEPGKRRFIIAYTNREVDELNAAARAAKKERGLLGEDVSLQTKDGPQSFATGRPDHFDRERAKQGAEGGRAFQQFYGDDCRYCRGRARPCVDHPA